MTARGDGRAGLGIFVKTPGLSPLKTRLAAGIGEAAALGFYRLAVDAVRAVALAAADSVAPHWAVAEEEALGRPDWSCFPALPQGEGGLGERMAAVYGALLARHGRALLIGADAPQVTPDLLRRAAAALEGPGRPYVIGPAGDGGFWLFGGRQAVPQAVWTGVAYSRSDTARRFLAALAPHGEASRLPPLSDVDTAAGLRTLEADLARGTAVPEQDTLLRWLRARA